MIRFKDCMTCDTILLNPSMNTNNSLFLNVSFYYKEHNEDTSSRVTLHFV